MILSPIKPKATFPFLVTFLKIFIVGIFFLSDSTVLFAQSYTDEIGTSSANDFYISNKDRYYTNGNLFHYRHALKQDGIDSTLEKKIFELESGQKIFNPFYAKAPDPATHDRPFTAYLYLGSSFNWFFKNGKMIRVTAQIGTIGPNALGEEVQTSYHKLLNIFKPRGWEYQLKNEMGLNLSADYNKLFYRSQNKLLDFTGLSTALLGNTFSGAIVGGMLRFGKINPMYESVSYNSLIGNRPSATNGRPKKEFFFFLKPLVNYVAYDATIEGGLFRKDKGPITFGAKPFVFQQDIGTSFSSPRWSVNFVATLKSKDVESRATGYTYATWSVLYRFNQKIVKW
jgi:lipid A 3-O-deacylase